MKKIGLNILDLDSNIYEQGLDYRLQGFPK